MPARKKPSPKDIKDSGGWYLGVSAALKGVFGTDAEIHVRHGDMDLAIKKAQDSISEMSEAAAQLMQTTDGKSEAEKDDIEEVFQNLVRDL